MPLINPATEEIIESSPFHTPAEAQAILSRAAAAFAHWRHVPLASRAIHLRKAGKLLRERAGGLARLMTTEMGKPIVDAEAEVEKCAGACDHFADHAAEYLQPIPIATDASRSYVRFDPLGPLLAIMPWNFPLWQVIRFAAPALVAGNVGVLKHAPNVPGCAAALETIFADAGFPIGTFASLRLANEDVAALLAHPAIAAVTLTGSERAGKSVAAAAGAALKKTVLELGGSDPFIILPDADADTTARAAALARTINAGQSCIAAKRFIIVGRHELFECSITDQMSRLVVGDPLARTTQIGPLARLDLLENLHRQVHQSIAAGARLLLGGDRLGSRGYFYSPTILADVRPGMPAFDEETFGPVAALVRADSIDEAIELANATRYGLAASIWTADASAAEKLAPRIESGSVFINGIVKSDARLPFGGIKQSGHGRELAAFGMHEFMNIKTVWMR
jgi:succinate-semialdehyde dehydrogenase / glutarate-semialdehyde dehydrogenase